MNWITKKIEMDMKRKIAKYEAESKDKYDKIYLEKYGKTFEQWCTDYFWERRNKPFYKELVAKKFRQ